MGTAALELDVLAGYWRLGWSVDDLAGAYPFLSTSEILDGLSYYLDHRVEVDRWIQANCPPALVAAYLT